MGFPFLLYAPPSGAQCSLFAAKESHISQSDKSFGGGAKEKSISFWMPFLLFSVLGGVFFCTSYSISICGCKLHS
jgi:hypothetical protein